MSLLSLCALLLLAVGMSMSVVINGRRMTMDEALMRANSGMVEMSAPALAASDGSHRKLMEIDIMLGTRDYYRMMWNSNSARRKKRNANRDLSTRWPGGRVSYEITGIFSSSERAEIMSAIADYHKYTCLRFVQSSSASDRIRFIKDGGCWSYVGRRGGVQDVSLSNGCSYKGIIIHELAHALGLWHEQSRPDRDDFVSIQTGNIIPAELHNFNKYSTSVAATYGVSYDYSSLMHYGAKAFTRNGNPTISAHNSRFQDTMGQREGFSFQDLKLINIMYDCPAKNGCAARSCTGMYRFQGPDCRCWCCSGNYLSLRGEPYFKC